MKKQALIRILANDSQKAEMLAKGLDNHSIVWVKDIHDLLNGSAEIYMDLLFHPSEERIKLLNGLQPAQVIIHSVTKTLAELQSPFIRVNAWPGFLERPIVEVAVMGALYEQAALQLLSGIRLNGIIVPDDAGFIAARVVAMIINEAYLALEDGVSSKENIDLAMKTGTNYPLGPFEWAKKIGLAEIVHLLGKLALHEPRYQPAKLLELEAAALQPSSS